jgi:hypothetical protein
MERSERRTGVTTAAVIALVLALIGCGGGSSSDAPAATSDLLHDANEFAYARVDLAFYCAGEQPDPSVDAKGAATTMLNITRLHPDVVYQHGVTYRQAVEEDASATCDPAIAEQLDSGLAGLP